jgi:hypothetical protein
MGVGRGWGWGGVNPLINSWARLGINFILLLLEKEKRGERFEIHSSFLSPTPSPFFPHLFLTSTGCGEHTSSRKPFFLNFFVLILRA